MARADIRGQDNQVISDSGATEISILKGEQLTIPVSVSKTGISSLSGYVITATAVEGGSVAGDGEVVPLSEGITPQITNLPIIDDDVNDTLFNILIPKALINSYNTPPTPSDPVYAFWSCTISNGQSGNAEWKRTILSGTIQVRYNPTEAS